MDIRTDCVRNICGEVNINYSTPNIIKSITSNQTAAYMSLVREKILENVLVADGRVSCNKRQKPVQRSTSMFNKLAICQHGTEVYKFKAQTLSYPFCFCAFRHHCQHNCAFRSAWNRIAKLLACLSVHLEAELQILSTPVCAITL